MKNRAEVLLEFEEHFVQPKSNEKVQALQRFVKDNEDSLICEFVEAFRTHCNQIKKQQMNKEKEKINFIMFSLLRTRLLEGKPLYLMEAFSEKWFLDRTECHGYYDATWAFTFLDELEIAMKEESKRYVDSIHISDIEQIKRRQAIIFHFEVLELAKKAMISAVKIPEYKEIVKEEGLEIWFGEYRDQSIKLYKEPKLGDC